MEQKTVQHQTTPGSDDPLAGKGRSTAALTQGMTKSHSAAIHIHTLLGKI